MPLRATTLTEKAVLNGTIRNGGRWKSITYKTEGKYEYHTGIFF